MSLPLTLSLLLSLAAAEPVEGETAVTSPESTSDTDPFLWLEEIEGAHALETVRRWNQRTQDALDADPRYAAFRDEALAILTSDARLQTGGIHGKNLEGFWRDTAHVRGLWRTTSLKSYLKGTPDWEVLLDVDALDEQEHQNWLWHGVTCAPQSDLCMIDLSRGGSDATVHREFSKKTRAFVPGGFEVPEAKSEVAWLDEDTLLVATDRGPGTLTESGYARTLVRWERGTNLADSPVVFEGQPSDVYVTSGPVKHGKRREILLYRAVTFYETEVWRLPADGAPVQLPLPPQNAVIGLFGAELIAQINQDWTYQGHTWTSGSLVALDLDTGAARLVLTPPPSGAIEYVGIGKTTIFVQMLDDVVGRLVRLTPDGDGFTTSDIALPGNGLVALSSWTDTRDDALVTFESLTVPSTLFHVGKNDAVHPLQSLPAFYDASDVVVEQRFATSPDGTRIPYFLMGKRDVLAAGPAPTIQYGYGGFLASMLPVYFDEEARPQHGAIAGRLWVSRGGVLAISNIRGGGEYGPTWHDSVLKADRQKAFDDFFAIGDHLVSTGVTTPAQLGAIGRSNGGLLMGVAMTQRPDLYAAIDCGVPLLDMMRYHQLLAGASWVAEYGDPGIPEERAVLERYSPYQLVRAGVDYPRMLFYTSTRDDRVHPGHARKMAAKLESLGIEFDYYENIEGGHGGVANQEQSAHRLAVEFAFLARELGLGR